MRWSPWSSGNPRAGPTRQRAAVNGVILFSWRPRPYRPAHQTDGAAKWVSDNRHLQSARHILHRQQDATAQFFGGRKRSRDIGDADIAEPAGTPGRLLRQRGQARTDETFAGKQ